MDGEAGREKIKLFLSYFCKRTVILLKKCVYLHDMKNKCIFLQKNVFYNKSKYWQVLAKIGCTKKYVLLQ